MVDLNGLISDLEMQKMDIDELDCYRSKLMNYRNITKDEEKEIKKIRRKVKNKQSSKLCRIKSKEEAKRIKSELEYLRLRCKELESKNEELMEIIRRSDSSER
ncbi:BZIP domain-containing protein [Entamoeba marina]